MMRRRWDYFVKYLLGAEPPKEFGWGRRGRRRRSPSRGGHSARRCRISYRPGKRRGQPLPRRPDASSFVDHARRAGVPRAVVVSQAQRPTRAIRRDVPLTNMIRRAFDAGTRDSTGRPAAATGSSRPTTRSTRGSTRRPQTLTGTRDDRAPQQQSDWRCTRSCCGSTRTSSAASCRAATSVPAENTDGMVVTKLAVNGEAVDLAAPRRRSAADAAAAAAAARAARSRSRPASTQTVARDPLADADRPRRHGHDRDRVALPSCPGGANGRGTA